MVEVLEFIFRGFWTYLGTLCLCAVIFGGLGGAFHTRETRVHRSEHREFIKHSS